MFETSKKDLVDLLKAAQKGRLQLPDFQRDYVWNDEDVRSLIASVARGFPVGALLTLQTGGELQFKTRLLKGVPDQGTSPEELLLDGQQRITSLYQATFSDAPVRTRTPKGKEVERYYYIDIKRAVNRNEDIEDAIEGMPGDKIRKKDFGRAVELDLSTEAAEFENDLFPLNLAYDSQSWLWGWQDHWKKRGRDVSELRRAFYENVIKRFERYEMPFIRLDKENSREAICLVFEKVNVGGKKLDAFELVTAIFAAKRFDLREDWNGPSDRSSLGRRGRIIGTPNRRDVLTKIVATDFLQACTLLHTREKRLESEREGRTGKDLPAVSCKREALLALPLHAYRDSADQVEAGFIEASSFLNAHKIIGQKDIPYPTSIIALAATFAILGKDARSAAVRDKLSRWFWSITLGELYGSGVETRLARDVPELVDWLSSDGSHPKSIDDALFQKDRLLQLRSRQSAAYKGLHALMMRQGCRDFITGKPVDIMTFHDEHIDIHHIFPQDWCKEKGIEPAKFNSVVNKTPLSSASNRAIGGRAPSAYLKRIEGKHESVDDLDEILKSHKIEPSHLRDNNFDAFFEARIDALADIVEDAMEKPVVREHGSDEREEDVGAIDEEAFEEQEMEAA